MTANATITKAEFESKWGLRPNRAAVPAEMDGPCDDEECEGWHWVLREIWEDDVKFGFRPASDLKAFD